jgi:S-methylmethionine-dependent homocysteine/selenocysteine methylase
VPFGAYANGGRWNQPADDPETYAAHAQRWVDAGATIVGGCCGTTPAHIATLRRRLQPDSL